MLQNLNASRQPKPLPPSQGRTSAILSPRNCNAAIALFATGSTYSTSIVSDAKETEDGEQIRLPRKSIHCLA